MAHRQPSTPGYRRNSESVCQDREVERAVRLTAEHFGASRSWVRNFAIGQFFGILVADFRRGEPKWRPRVKRTFQRRAKEGK